ncbi:hypothetical protein ANN_10388 [Periplaneta americana]|uniref:Reverse transcriptase domain-containing protein n=1 Tax=Periplaneta americana TaxID=6978 RepID=A0ABQ8TQR5_PERAM|nr:hypothetical protein ANN_10388 [Periplaneta americana]
MPLQKNTSTEERRIPPQKKEEYLRRRKKIFAEERRISPQKKEEYLQRRILSEKNISAEDSYPTLSRCVRRANVEFSIVTNKAEELQSQLVYHLDVRLPCPRWSTEEYLRRRKKNISAEERRISAEERRISPQKKEEYLRRRKKNITAERVLHMGNKAVSIAEYSEWEELVSNLTVPPGRQLPCTRKVLEEDLCRRKKISAEERRSPQKKEDLRRRKKNISTEEKDTSAKNISIPFLYLAAKIFRIARNFVVQPGHQLAVSHMVRKRIRLPAQRCAKCATSGHQLAVSHMVRKRIRLPAQKTLCKVRYVNPELVLLEYKIIKSKYNTSVLFRYLSGRITENLYNLDISLPCPIWSVQELDCLLNAMQSALHGPRAVAVTGGICITGHTTVQPYQGTECYMHAIHMRAANRIEMEGETSASKLRYIYFVFQTVKEQKERRYCCAAKQLFLDFHRNTQLSFLNVQQFFLRKSLAGYGKQYYSKMTNGGPLQRRGHYNDHDKEKDHKNDDCSPAYDVNRLGENPQTIKENAEILVEASRAIGLEVNPEKTKYMIMSRDQNIVRNGTIKIGDLSFEEVEKFKYLGATVTNLNDTREEIKLRINMGNACYYSVEKLLSSSLLSKSLKVRIYKTVILPVVLYGCETWTLTLREEQRLRVFENKVLRKIFGAKRDEVTGEWRKLHNAELHALYTSPDIIRNIKSRRLRWAGHVARMGESRNAYRVLVGRPEGKRPLGRPRRRWEDNIKMDLRRHVGQVQKFKRSGRLPMALCTGNNSRVLKRSIRYYNRLDHLVAATKDKKRHCCAYEHCKRQTRFQYKKCDVGI